jgi:hypothetical protein
MSRLDRLFGPCWDGAILQLDSCHARHVKPKGLTAEINKKINPISLERVPLRDA